jgi:murein DD-endopeptidase MepM/ murein hydrolase activator NlpD
VAQIENLGFEARIDVTQAQGALGKLEAGLRALQEAFARASRSRIPMPDATGFGRSVSQMEERLRAASQASLAATNQLDKALATMAALTNQRVQAAARGSTNQLEQLDRKILQVQQRIRTLHAQPVGPAGGMGGGGAGGAMGAGAMGGGRGPGGGGVPHHLAMVPATGARTANVTNFASGMAQSGGSVVGSGLGTVVGASMGSAVPVIGTAIGAALGGMVGGTMLNTMLGFVSGAVARQSEEYIRETNLFSRDSVVRGLEPNLRRETVEATAERVQLAGRADLFTREETRGAYEALARGQGFVSDPALLSTLNFTRAFGLSAQETAGQIGRAGLFTSLDGDLTRQLAAGIQNSGMMERTEEALEASVSLLEGLGGRIGKLNDTQTAQLLAFQASLAGTNNPLFQGQRGARVAQDFMGAMADGATDDQMDALITQGLMRYGSQVDPSFDPQKATYFDMLKYRETNALDTAKSFSMFARNELGMDDTVVQMMLRKMTGWSATQTGAFYENFFKPGKFGDQGLIQAKDGQRVIDQGREVQRKAFFDQKDEGKVGRAELARKTALDSEDFDRAIGYAGFRSFKELQSTVLGVGNNLMNFVNPAIAKFNELLANMGDVVNGRLPGGQTGFAARSDGSPGGRVPPGVAAGRLFMTGGRGQVTSEAAAVRRNPVTGQMQPHDGMDVGAAAGTPVYAAEAGTVRFAGPAGDMGNMVAIDHEDGSMSRYGHLLEVLVGTGQQVSRGQMIGKVGSTGRSTGPHLHFEVRRGGQAMGQAGVDQWLQQHGGGPPGAAPPASAPAPAPGPTPRPAGTPRPGPSPRPAQTGAVPGVNPRDYAGAPAAAVAGAGGAAIGMQVAFSQNFQVVGGDPEQVRRAAREGAIEGYKQAATMLAGMTMGNV